MTTQNVKRSAALEAWAKQQGAKDRMRDALAASDLSGKEAARAVRSAWDADPNVRARRAAAEREATTLRALMTGRTASP
jgi:hypothetical protein